MDTVQIVGVGPDPVRVHIHGNRKHLMEDPEGTHLFIRRIRPKTQGRTVHWQLLSARCAMPAPDRPSRTVLGGNVYPHLQHALFACLLRSLGGAARFRYQPQTFPMIYAEGGIICPAVTDACMGMHWMADEPSHSQLCDFGRQLLQTSVRLCMLVIGPLQPVPNRWPSGRPQLRGILLDASAFASTDGSLPPSAVQTGWYPCLSEEGLVFALHGEHDGRPLPPVILRSLSGLGLSLRKRSDGPVYALDGKQRDANTWERAIQRSDDVPMNGFSIHSDPITADTQG